MPAATRSVSPVRWSVRSWARELADAPKPIKHSVSGGCGLVVKSERSREEHVALLANVGWTTCNDGMRCPECSAGVIRRVVIGSQGDPYVVRHFGDAWQCSCLGYAHRKRCWHADA